MLLFCLLVTCAIHAHAYDKDDIRNIKDYILDKAPVVERQLFHLRKNGLKVDVKVVSSYGNDSTAVSKDDHFPDFPARDIGECIVEFSLGCVKRRFVRLLQSISRLDEITLLGQDVKLIRNRAAREFDQHNARAVNDSTDVGRAVDDFFSSFTLRITLPRWNGKREKNQIDVMLDEKTAVEGRKKGGGGGGGGIGGIGGGCGGGGKGGGGGCMMMMMGMLMMLKMKFLGLAALKGMMMGGMSMMMLLMHKLGKGGGGGPWQGGGGGGPWQGGGQLKEIVLLTKSSHGGGGGGGGGGCCGPSSHGASPPSSYGSSSGGGGYGGGGGWGRSFHKRPMTLSYDRAIKREPADNNSNGNLMIGEVISKPGNMDYPDYQDYQEPSPIVNSNFTASHWNATNNIAFYEYNDVNSLTNDSKLTTNAKDWSFNENSVNTKTGNDDSVAGTKYQAGLMEGANSAYMDEWQATGEKINTNDVSNRNARVFQLRSRHVPLLRGI